MGWGLEGQEARIWERWMKRRGKSEGEEWRRVSGACLLVCVHVYLHVCVLAGSLTSASDPSTHVL